MARACDPAEVNFGLAQQARQLLYSVSEIQNLDLAQLINLLMQELDLEFGLDIDLIIILGRLAINVLLSILAHHDEGCRIGGLERERQIEQNKRVWVPLLHEGRDVKSDPEHQSNRLDDDKGP